MRARRSAQPLPLPEPPGCRAEPRLPAHAARGGAAEDAVRALRLVGGRRGRPAARRDGHLPVAARARSAGQAGGRHHRQDAVRRVERPAAAARTRRRAVIVALAVLAAPAAAAADPLLEGPPVRVVVRGGGPQGTDGVGLVAEVRAVGVGSAARLATWPDRNLGIEMQRPQLVALRAGFVGWLQSCGCPDRDLERRRERAEHPCAPFVFVARADLAEFDRPFFDRTWPATVSAVIDDLYVWWRPSRAASLLVGRAPVVWSKTR